MNVVLWILQVVLAVAFLAAGAMKASRPKAELSGQMGWVDDFSAEATALAARRIRELAEHAQANGQQISLEMYEDTYVGTADRAVDFLHQVDHEACGLNPDLGNLLRLHRPLEPIMEQFEKTLPYANYWHVKNYLRDEDPASGTVTSFPLPMDVGFIDYRTVIGRALELGFRGAFLCEHYGSDMIGVIAKNRTYLREVLATLID